MSNVLQLIGWHEDLRLKPYDDATGKELQPGDVLQGKITIGIGRNLSDNGITKDEAVELFQADVDNIQREIREALPWTADLNDVRFDALTDMGFNMGLTRLLGFKNTLAFLRDKRYSDAADELLKSKYAKTHATRAGHLASMFRTGRYAEPDSQ